MSWEYSCPKCKTMLNPGPTVILIASRKKDRIMIGFHPKPGKYEVYLPPNVVTEEGSKWDFSCPMCHENLQTAEDKNLCELELQVNDQPQRILFSRVAGEHATFIVHGSTVKEKLGDDAPRYKDIMGLMKHMRY